MKQRTLGETISALRKAHGMTQAALAEKMNVTDKAVSKWERDLSCPDINSLPRLAEIFSVSVDELMQIKTCAEKNERSEKIGGMIDLIFRGIALAMGVAVTVTSILNKTGLNSATATMLGIGLSCLAITLIDESRRDVK